MSKQAPKAPAGHSSLSHPAVVALQDSCVAAGTANWTESDWDELIRAIANDVLRDEGRAAAEAYCRLNEVDPEVYIHG